MTIDTKHSIASNPEFNKNMAGLPLIQYRAVATLIDAQLSAARAAGPWNLLREARAALETWKDVAPAVSLCADIDRALATQAAPAECSGCDPAEGFCAYCREKERKERATQAAPSRQKPDIFGDRWHSLTCDGTCSPPCADAAPSVSVQDERALLPLSAGLPSPDDHDRVLVYTEGVDFAGEQYFDIKTDDLWEIDDEARTEVVEAATHWMPLPRPARATLAHSASQAAQGEHDYADPTLACSSCGLTMGESRTLGHLKLGLLAANPAPSAAPAMTGPLDANELERMAKAHPDECFLKGSGVLKLVGAIRTLEQSAAAVTQGDHNREWRNIRKVVQEVAKFCFGGPAVEGQISIAAAYMSVVTCLTAKDGLRVELDRGAAPAQVAQGEPVAWMKPDEIKGLLEAASDDVPTRHYGRIYARQYDADMVQVYAAPSAQLAEAPSQAARDVLAACSGWVQYEPGDADAVLDGRFTIPEIEAIAACMREDQASAQGEGDGK